MYDMLKDDTLEYWGNAQQVVFDMLKKKLTSVSIRTYLNFDKLFKLYIDAPDLGLGAVLVQDDKQERERVIAYNAKRLN